VLPEFQQNKYVTVDISCTSHMKHLHGCILITSCGKSYTKLFSWWNDGGSVNYRKERKVCIRKTIQNTRIHTILLSNERKKIWLLQATRSVGDCGYARFKRHKYFIKTDSWSQWGTLRYRNALHWNGTATYRCDDTRGCIIQFWPPDDEHMVLETCRGIK